MEYLMKKWKMWYNSMDVNHDGKVSVKDVQESENKFTDLHELVGEKANRVQDNIDAWWNKYIFGTGTKKEISESEFVEKLTEAYKKDKIAFKREMQACFDCIYAVLDANKDRNIDLDEYINASKAFGHENEAMVRKIFSLFNVDPENEALPVRDIVSAWVTFVTEEDSDVTDIIMEAFSEGL